MARIVTVGEILVEVMTRDVNQTFLQSGVLHGPFASGAPAIFIDSAAKMGGDAAIISAVGKDDFGTLNINRLRGDGVNVDGVKVLNDATTGVAFVTYFDDGERQFIYHFTNSAAGNIRIAPQDERVIANAEYLHIMGCSISASAVNRESLLRAANIARDSSVKISFDPNIRPELLNDKEVRAAFDSIMRHASVIMAGVRELSQLMGKDSAVTAAQELLAGNCEVVVIRDGRNPVKAYTREDVCSADTVDYGEFVDATGAGDCFDGAFIAALSNGFGVADALLYATTAGSLSVTKKGPMEGTVTLEQVKAALNHKGGV